MEKGVISTILFLFLTSSWVNFVFFKRALKSIPFITRYFFSRSRTCKSCVSYSLTTQSRRRSHRNLTQVCEPPIPFHSNNVISPIYKRNYSANPQKCGMVFLGWCGPKACGELNFITIFVRREEAAVKQQIVLFPEVDGELETAWCTKRCLWTLAGSSRSAGITSLLNMFS